MNESNENLWKHYGTSGHIIGISTNGFVKNNGEAVMGRGCALEAKKRFPDIAKRLGDFIKANNNVPGYITGGFTLFGQDDIMILPVKHNWWEKADFILVQDSIRFLEAEASLHKHETYHVPRLGCGNGKLSWEEQVKHIMAILPDNVFVHSFGEE